MEADEVLEWRTYLSLEPRGQLRSDYHAAQICYAIYTIMSSFSGGKNKIKLKDCLLDFEQKEKDLDKVTLKNVMIMAQAFGRNKAGIPNLIKKIQDIEKNNEVDD